MNQFTEITEQVQEVTSDLSHWYDSCKKLFVSHIIHIKHKSLTTAINILAIRSDYSVIGEIISDLELISEIPFNASNLVLGIIYKKFNKLNRDNYDLLTYIPIGELSNKDGLDITKLLSLNKDT